MKFTNFYFLGKRKSQINYYLLCPICKKGKNFIISYDPFDKIEYCLLSESTKKNYLFLCCDRNNFLNIDVAFNKETMTYLKFQLKYSTFLKTLENLNLRQ